MKIDICLRVNDIVESKVNGKVTVVFDVLRATSTIVSALVNGCRGVIPVAGVDEAKEMASRLREKGLPVMLGGERGGRKLPGFDGGNSPLEYTPTTIGGKLLVLTTSNGTRTIKACTGADTVYAGSLLNAAAVARRLQEMGKDAVLACAGTRGEFSLEDAVAAGLVITHLVRISSGDPGSPNIELCDAATAMHRLALGYGNDTGQCLYDSVHGKKLLDLGFAEDLKQCGKVDEFDIVPKLDKEKGCILL